MVLTIYLNYIRNQKVTINKKAGAIDEIFVFDSVKKNIFVQRECQLFGFYICDTLDVFSFHPTGLFEFTSIHFIRVALKCTYNKIFLNRLKKHMLRRFQQYNNAIRSLSNTVTQIVLALCVQVFLLSDFLFHRWLPNSQTNKNEEDIKHS